MASACGGPELGCQEEREKCYRAHGSYDCQIKPDEGPHRPARGLEWWTGPPDCNQERYYRYQYQAPSEPLSEPYPIHGLLGSEEFSDARTTLGDVCGNWFIIDESLLGICSESVDLLSQP